MPAGRYGNFLNSVKKLVNYVRYNMPKYYVLHLLLTVAENLPEIHFENLHRVTQFIDCPGYNPFLKHLIIRA
jgi:hypothetical protein